MQNELWKFEGIRAVQGSRGEIEEDRKRSKTIGPGNGGARGGVLGRGKPLPLGIEVKPMKRSKRQGPWNMGRRITTILLYYSTILLFCSTIPILAEV